MTGVNFVKRGILPLAAIAVLLYLGKYFYLVDGQIDWFRLIMVIGIPMGIPYMFIVVPMHWDLSGIAGLIAFCVVIGGFGGFIIAGFLVIRAFVYLIGYPIAKLAGMALRRA